jgi:hypothetical protein
MFGDRAPFIIGAVLAAVSLLVAVWKEEGMMIGTSIVALCVTVPAAMYCPRSVSKYSLIAAVTVLVCTVLIGTVLSLESAVGGGMMTRDAWSYVTAVIECVAVIPLIILLHFVSASAFGASYNWALVSVLSFFVGLGMMLAGHAVIFFAQRSKIDVIVTKTDVVAELLMSVIIFALLAVILSQIFKKRRYLITKNGLEARQ